MMGDEQAKALNAAILAAHNRDDASDLAGLYHRAAQLMGEQGDVEAFAFLLTQAYVFALESDHPLQTTLHSKLVELGREQF